MHFSPIVAVHYAGEMEPLLSEGVGVFLAVDGIESDESYQMAVTTAGEQFHWEFSAVPFESGGSWYVGAPDLLLPPEKRLPDGLWHVELFSADGVRREESFSFSRSSSTMNRAFLDIAYLPELTWERHADGWSLAGVPSGELWSYTFFNAEGGTIHTIDNRVNPLFISETVKSRTTLLVALHYDPELDCFSMIRTEFTTTDSQIPIIADE